MEAGAVVSRYQDEVFRNLKCSRIRVDELRAFVGAKQKNVTRPNVARCPNKAFGALKGPCPHPLLDQRLNVGAGDFDGHDCGGPPLFTVADVGLSVTKFKPDARAGLAHWGSARWQAGQAWH